MSDHVMKWFDQNEPLTPFSFFRHQKSRWQHLFLRYWNDLKCTRDFTSVSSSWMINSEGWPKSVLAIKLNNSTVPVATAVLISVKEFVDIGGQFFPFKFPFIYSTKRFTLKSSYIFLPMMITMSRTRVLPWKKPTWLLFPSDDDYHDQTPNYW